MNVLHAQRNFYVLSEDLEVGSDGFVTEDGMIVRLPEIALQDNEDYEAEGEQRMKLYLDGTPIEGNGAYATAFRVELFARG